MVWYASYSCSESNIVNIVRRQNSKAYCNVLEIFLSLFCDWLFDSHFTFKQGNAAIHVRNISKKQ